MIKDTYVDDCATGADSDENVEQLALDMNELLSKGGFTTKGYSFSGRPPPPALTKDGESVSVLGYKWFTAEDVISIAFGPLSFAKKYRGKKQVTTDSHLIPEELNRSICLGKVHELFDPCGLSAPLMAGFKLDIRDLYDGESGFNCYTRGAQHQDGLRLKEEDNPLWKHCLVEHEGQIAEFSMKQANVFRTSQQGV